MKTGIILATHGLLARELLNSCQMLFGDCEKVLPVCYMPEQSIETLLENIEKSIKILDDMSVVIIFCDMKGGSPCNVSLRIASANSKITVISGVNVPVLLETLSIRSNTKPEEVISSITHVINNSIEIINKR